MSEHYSIKPKMTKWIAQYIKQTPKKEKKKKIYKRKAMTKSRMSGEIPETP